MNILFLDVASHRGLIAAVTPEGVVASHDIVHRITDRELVAAIDDVLVKASWTHRDLTHVACVTGPGGFMSVRSGISAANALAWALGVPLCGIHLSDLYYANFKHSHEAISDKRLAIRTDNDPALLTADRLSLAAPVIWLHSTKKTHLFLRAFGVHQKIEPEPTLMHIDEAIAAMPENAIVIGELIPEHEAALAARGLHLEKLLPMHDILPGFLSAQTYRTQTLLPWYGRGI